MKKNKEFSNAYMSITQVNREHIKIRNEIVNRCKISASIFYNYTMGLTSVPDHFKPIIAEVMEVPVNKIFPDSEQLIISEENIIKLITRKFPKQIPIDYETLHSPFANYGIIYQSILYKQANCNMYLFAYFSKNVKDESYWLIHIFNSDEVELYDIQSDFLNNQIVFKIVTENQLSLILSSLY